MSSATPCIPSRRLRTAARLGAVAAAAWLAAGLPAAAQSPAAADAGAATQPRQIVLDTPGTPSHAAPAASRVESPLAAAHQSVHAAALGDLGLAMLRWAAVPSTPSANAVVSPLSVASAIGLVHAGASGETRRELALLLSSGPAADVGFSRQLPALLEQLAGPGDGTPAALQVANRMWVHAAAAAHVPEAYRQTIAGRYGGDIAALDFAQPAAAVQSINGWASERTAGRIPSIVSTDSVTTQTRAVLTNAVHFKQPWAKSFDPAATRPRPFAVPGGSESVPTMAGERTVLAAEQADGTTVYELPFDGDRFSMLIVLPAASATLKDFEARLSGADLLALAGAVRPRQCLLELPRLSLRRDAGSLRPVLQALGVKNAFGPQAEFGPMLGEVNARDLSLSDVLHAATFVIDETGGEAAAATAAVAGVRSAAPLQQPQVCAVDRPFLYALRHRASGAPLFVGRVVDPRRP